MDLRIGDRYFYISDSGNIVNDEWMDWQIQIARIDMGNAFLTYKEARKELARRKTERILIRDTKGFKPNIYNLGQKRYYVSYDPCCKDLCCLCEGYCAISHEILFATRSDAQESIKNHEKEWLIYLGGGELDGYNQKWENSIYLCPKHAKKLREMLCIDFGDE